MAHEFVNLIMAIFYLNCVDRLNVTALAGVEHMARRVLQIQRAVKKNAKAPDFDSLDSYMRHTADASGAAQCPTFEKHIAELQKTEATVAKSLRLAREEQTEEGQRVKAKTEKVEKQKEKQKNNKNTKKKEEDDE